MHMFAYGIQNAGPGYREKELKHEGLADLMIPLTLWLPLQLVNMVIKLVKIIQTNSI